MGNRTRGGPATRRQRVTAKSCSWPFAIPEPTVQPAALEARVWQALLAIEDDCPQGLAAHAPRPQDDRLGVGHGLEGDLDGVWRQQRQLVAHAALAVPELDLGLGEGKTRVRIEQPVAADPFPPDFQDWCDGHLLPEQDLLAALLSNDQIPPVNALGLNSPWP